MKLKLSINDYNRWAIPKNDTLDKPITPQKTSRQAKKLKNKKATANDSLSNEIVKLAVKTLPSYFTIHAGHKRHEKRTCY